MAGKDKDEKTNRPPKGSPPKEKPRDTGAQRPEQKQAVGEEEQTLKASESRQPEAGAGAPIVAVGASAGGLEALDAFFAEVPEDSGLIFVVITHTDPDRQSILPDLIKKNSRIPVHVIQDGVEPRPDAVYVPPSNRDVVLKKNTFRLVDRPHTKLHMPVDLFLRHLAEEREEMSACVILSGTGTDGTEGLKRVKEKAGLAVAQTPDSARHAGMPNSAAETGLLDYQLPPWEIPGRLIDYFRQPAAIERAPQEKEKPDPLRRILTFLADRTRNDFSQYKENTLIRRIERRMTVTRSRNSSEYMKLLNQDSEEVRSLFQDLLIGVTSFFRDPEAFAYLQQQVLPELIFRRKGRTFRAWVPGCATGEEAYSVAIILQEVLENQEGSRDIQVFGTDIDRQAIEQARQGSYVQNIISDVSPERIKRFFDKEDSRYRVKPDIRDRVVFAEQNLLADPPFSQLDLLVCRNLLIYLKPETQNRLIPLFHYSLLEGGILFLGTSESVGRFHDIFESMSRQYSIYRKKNHTIRPQVEFPTAIRLDRPSQEKEGEPERKEGVGQAVEKILMEEHTPACVVVNQSGELLHVHGRVGKYLEMPPGAPTTQIADMARQGLRFPMLTLLRRVDTEEGEMREKDVRVKTNHEDQLIDLVVKSFSKPPLKGCRMIIFVKRPQPPEAVRKPGATPSKKEESEQAEALEQELLRLRQDYRTAIEELQTSNEELRSSNEELHSSNEELQSTNEELESSREELQSLNEELNTVNSELNSKIEQLQNAYRAINTVLNNTRIAIVFLDNDLRVKRFTPESSELLNLIQSDLGRPLDHISHNLEYNDLVKRARRVLKTLSEIDEEVQTKEGHWYRMRIMLYRPEGHVIEGVVLTFINIDAQKRAQEKLEEARRRELSSAKRFAENVVDTVRESLLVLDSRMQVVTANRRFYETFRTKPDQTEGKNFFELGKGQWDISKLRELLGKVIQQNWPFQDYRVDHQFPEIGFKRMVLNARMLRQEDMGEDRILLAIEDITDIEDLGAKKNEQ